MVKKIFIIVGSKGGSGKTPISLAIGATLFWKLNKTVAFLDLGYVNPDLRRICFNMITKHDPSSRIVKELVYEVDGRKRELNVLNISQSRLLLVSRAEDFLYTPLSYLEISEILSKVASEVNAEYLIVDTNLSLLNFKNRFPLIKSPSIDSIVYFVNVWSLTLTTKELEELYKPGIAQILRVNNLKDENLIHVFSPRFIKGSKNLLRIITSLFKTENFQIDEYFDMTEQLLQEYILKMKRSRWSSIDSSFIIDLLETLNKYFLSFKYGAFMQGGKAMVEALFKGLYDYLIHWDIFPQNLLINPLLREKLAYFSELFSNTRISLEHINMFLENDSALVKMYIEKAYEKGFI